MLYEPLAELWFMFLPFAQARHKSGSPAVVRAHPRRDVGAMLRGM